MAKGEAPIFRVSAGTAFKAGFFGAIGFLVAQVIIGSSVLVIAIALGIGSLGFLAGRAANHAPAPASSNLEEVQPTRTLSRETPRPATPGGQDKRDR
jgi:hypothetical protein